MGNGWAALPTHFYMNNGLQKAIELAEKKQGIKETALHRMLRIASDEKEPTKSKFNVVDKEDRTSIDNVVFDSKGELNRYPELQLLQKAGQISDLELQKRFVLLPDFQYRDKKIRGITYIADFYYIENGHPIVEEIKVKATRTKDAIIKHKLFMSMYPHIEFREVVLDE